jgi:hypothetical protein
MPGKDNRFVALALHTRDRTIKNNADFPERQSPEERRVQTAFDPRPQEV